jgi:hypothetical protein
LIDSFSEFSSLFRLFLTLLVSTASAEWVMSSLKRIKKKHCCATLSEKNLKWIQYIFIERSVANKINLETTIEIFAEARKQFTITWITELH